MPHAPLLNVSVVEDNTNLRNGIQWMLASTPGYTCAGAFGSCEEALDAWAATPPRDGEIILMDIGLPGMSGLEGTARIRTNFPQARVIVLTMFEDTETIMQAIRAGAVGYLVKSTPPQELLQALRVVQAGGSSLSGPIALRILQELQAGPSVSPHQVFDLTPREGEILEGLVDGLTYQGLADRLYISIDTVRSHIKTLYEKLHVHSRNEAVTKALRHGLRPSDAGA